MTRAVPSSGLHAARPAAGAAFSLGLLAIAVAWFGHPLVLCGLLFAAAAALAAAGAARPLPAGLRFGVALAVLWALANPLVDHNGLTVLARVGSIPPFGEVDITLEATVYGFVLGLSVIAIVTVTSLAAATLDGDELLRLFRRASFRSALTAALATRLAPVLVADARRLTEAQRCRPDGARQGLSGRAQIVSAVTAGALDRALDVAATLEVRGYGAARRPPHRPRPWSRHDVAFTTAGLVLLALAVGGRLAGIGTFDAYPRLHAAAGPSELALCAAIVIVALLPFADRRGIMR